MQLFGGSASLSEWTQFYSTTEPPKKVQTSRFFRLFFSKFDQKVKMKPEHWHRRVHINSKMTAQTEEWRQSSHLTQPHRAFIWISYWNGRFSPLLDIFPLTSDGVRLHQDTFDPPALLVGRGGRGQRGGTLFFFTISCLNPPMVHPQRYWGSLLWQKSSAYLNTKELNQCETVCTCIVHDMMLTGPEGTQTAAEHRSL